VPRAKQHHGIERAAASVEALDQGDGQRIPDGLRAGAVPPLPFCCPAASLPLPPALSLMPLRMTVANEWTLSYHALDMYEMSYFIMYSMRYR